MDYQYRKKVDSFLTPFVLAMFVLVMLLGGYFILTHPLCLP